MFDKEMFHRYMGMSPNAFEELLSLVATKLTKQTTNYRISIPQEQRLSLTIRHLATGESLMSLSFQYSIGRQTVSEISPETCIAIYEALASIHLKKSDSPEQWMQISKRFEKQMEYALCCRCLGRQACPHSVPQELWHLLSQLLRLFEHDFDGRL